MISLHLWRGSVKIFSLLKTEVIYKYGLGIIKVLRVENICIMPLEPKKPNFIEIYSIVYQVFGVVHIYWRKELSSKTIIIFTCFPDVFLDPLQVGWNKS